MASFVAHNLRVLILDVGLGTKSGCQRDLDSMKKIRDYRKPWDRVVPIYHAMLSKGGRVMHSFLGFLGMVILFIAMVNYAHADMGREDTEGLRVWVMIASETESSSLGLAHRDSTQDDGEIEAVEDRVDNTGMIDSSRVEHIRAPADLGRAGSGTGKRIVKKLGVGVLGGCGGAVLGAALGALGTGGGGAADGIPFVLGGLLGYTAGTAVGVTRIDPYDHLISTLLGSVIGMAVGLKEMPNSFHIEEWSESWPVFAYPVIGATIMSELSRYIPESSRFFLGLAPDRRGRLSAVAMLRF